MIWPRAIPRSTAGSTVWRACLGGSQPTICCRANACRITRERRSAVHPRPGDAEHDHAGNNRYRDRPGTDADIADDLSVRLVARDLAVAGLVVLIGRAHRRTPVSVWRQPTAA